MKSFILTFAILISSSIYGIEIQDQEYANSALAAAKAINNLNWAEDSTEIFEVAKEVYTNDGVHSFGTYTVKSFRLNEQNEKVYTFVEFIIEIFDGAIMQVTVDCKNCG